MLRYGLPWVTATPHLALSATDNAAPMRVYMVAPLDTGRVHSYIPAYPLTKAGWCMHQPAKLIRLSLCNKTEQGHNRLQRIRVMPRKLKVLFFQSQSYFGSDSMMHSLLMRNYDRGRIEVHVACNYGTSKVKSPSLKALETIPNLHVRPTHFGPTVTAQSKLSIAKDTVRGIPAVSSLAGLAMYMKQHSIDIVHGTEKPRDAFYGVALARLTGAKSVVHLHQKCTMSALSPLTVWGLQHADAIIGVSKFIAQSVIANGFDAGKVYYMLNGLDASRWDYTVDGTTVRQEFGIAAGTPVLAIISRLFYWKGHIELLKALAKVREETPNVKLLLVGEDDTRAHPGRGSFLQELKVLTHELDLEQNVIFTGFRKDIPQILAACDIYTMPTFEEPCAVAFLEAMAMKKPVIALDSGGTPELVDHGQAGLLSKPKDVDELAANILTLLRDPELRCRMGQYARTRVEQYYHPQRMASDAERIYGQVIGRHTT